MGVRAAVIDQGSRLAEERWPRLGNAGAGAVLGHTGRNVVDIAGFMESSWAQDTVQAPLGYDVDAAGFLSPWPPKVLWTTPLTWPWC